MHYLYITHQVLSGWYWSTEESLCAGCMDAHSALTDVLLGSASTDVKCLAGFQSRNIEHDNGQDSSTFHHSSTAQMTLREQFTYNFFFFLIVRHMIQTVSV